MKRQPYTPWNTSKHAVLSVTNPLPPPALNCTYCGGIVDVYHRDEIENPPRNEWPWFYACADCGARVGMHPETDIPLGTLADARTRFARQDAKQAFHAYITQTKTHPKVAYSILALAMHIPVGQCHFGMFTIPMCDRAKACCEKLITQSANH